MRNFISKKSLTKKFLIYMLLIGLVPLLFFGVLSIMSADNVLKGETIAFHEQFVDQRKQYIDLVMSDIESLATNLSGIEDIQEALTQSPTDNTYSRLSTQAKIGYILSGYTNLKGLVSIDIFSDYGVHFHVGETLNANNVNIDLKERLYSEVESSNDFIYWSGIEKSINQDSKYPYAITAAKLLRVKSNPGLGSEYKGLLVISYDPNVFSEGLTKYQNNAGYSLILDSKKRIVFHPNSEFIGYEISDKVSSGIKDESGYFEQSIDGKDTLVIYSKALKGGWSVESIISVEKIYDKSKIIAIIFIGLLLVSIGAIVIFQGMVSRNVVFPIKKVTDTFRALQQGTLENAIRLHVKSGDEIGELGNLFNSFIDAREDITIQKKLERQLNDQNAELQEALDRVKTTQLQMLQNEKLAAIGQLAAGVAHEINNPLGYVSSNCEILNKYINSYENFLTETEKVINSIEESNEKEALCLKLKQSWKDNKIDLVREDVLEILVDNKDGLYRIAAIVNGLKSFSRVNQNEEKAAFDINEGIRTTLLVANNELKYNCDVEFQQGEVPTIEANGGQINQVILNILINAVQAIKEKHGNSKGKIKIKTSSDAYNVCFSIEDNGCGMSEETKKRVFEPFFTTKPVGQGTGLGMGISYDIIVNKHNGKFEVSSEISKGTCFTITLPRE